MSIEQRFTLDETKALEWLQRAVAAYKWDLFGEGDEPEGDEELPEIGEDWQSTDPGQENTIYHLVRLAREDSKIIARPDDSYDLDFEYVDDEDGGYYYFLVRVGKLKLASFGYEMRKIDGRDEKGIAAALAILREAVSAANGVLGDLSEYVDSRR
jgi:hypothetical protein